MHHATDHSLGCFSRIPSLRAALPLLLAMLVLALIAPPGCQGSHGRPERYRAAERDTARARALNERAADRIERGELGRAEDLLRQALEADLMFGPAHNNLGKVYYQQSKLYQAAWEFEYAIKLMPNHPGPRNNLALVLESGRKLDEAVAYYREALQIEPDNAEVLGNLIRTRLRRGDRGDDLREQLADLILKDTRRQWVDWAKEKHALLGGS